MKKKILVIAVSALIAGNTYAQEAVFDMAAVEQAMKQVDAWSEQYNQMKDQIDKLQQTYQSMTGSRGMGNIMNDPALRDYLPGDWQAVYDSVKNGGYEGLSGRAQDIYQSNNVFDSCAHITLDDQRKLCESRAVKGAQDKAFALDAYDKARNRLNQIDQLMAQIDGTSDPKAIAELQGRIAAEQAMIQNEQTKLQLYQMVAQAEDRVQQQQQREMQARTWAARGVTNVEPLTFDAP